MTSLKLNETKKLEVLLRTAKYQIEGCPYSKDTCQLFINDSVLFSGAAFRHFLKNDNNILGRWSLLSLSKSENHLDITIIDDLPLTILHQIAEPLQNHIDGKQRKRPEDMITRQEIDEYRAKHQESEIRRKSPTNSAKGDLNIDDDVETDDKIPQNLDSYISEGQITHDTDVETDNVPLNLNYNIPEEGVTHDPLQTVPSKKEHNHSFWTTGIKTKQSKVKTQSRPQNFKICLQSRDDEVRDLVNDYFGDDIIRQCVQDFFESDVNPIRRQKRVYERPHIQWPSMHPRLPYKLRYLDEHVDDNGSGNQDHVQQQTFSPTAAGEYNEERSSDSTSVKSDSSDDETK